MGWDGAGLETGGVVGVGVFESPGGVLSRLDNMEGGGRKRFFTMQAEVIWRLDAFNEQEEEKE